MKNHFRLLKKLYIYFIKLEVKKSVYDRVIGVCGCAARTNIFMRKIGYKKTKNTLLSPFIYPNKYSIFLYYQINVSDHFHENTSRFETRYRSFMDKQKIDLQFFNKLPKYS